MSYSILFDDKFARLSDGRLIYFSRWGCNNDNAGRGRDEYHAKIFTDESVREYVKSLKESSLPVSESVYGGDFKIRSRWATDFDLGSHLERMIRRAVPFHQMKQERRLRGKVLDKIEVAINGGEPVEYTPKEWDKVWADIIYGNDHVETKYHSHFIYDEEEFTASVINDETVEFYIGVAE